MQHAPVNDLLQRLSSALANGGFPHADKIEEGSPTIASPMRLGLEWQGFRVTIGTQHYYAKVLLEETAPLVNVANSAAASRLAGQSGAAPLLLLADTEQGVLLFQALPPDEWRAACIDDLIAPENLAAVWELKRKLHRSAATDAALAVQNIGHDLAHLHALCVRDGAYLTADADDIHQALLSACHVLSATQIASVLIHGDGVASNVMVHESGALKLVDFDRGALADPWYDVATSLNELAQFPAAWREGIAAWQGHCSDADYARCRLYGLVDDWFWTLSILWLSATSPRQIDFIKLAQWTLLRVREGLKEDRLEAWMALVTSAFDARHLPRKEL